MQREVESGWLSQCSNSLPSRPLGFLSLQADVVLLAKLSQLGGGVHPTTDPMDTGSSFLQDTTLMVEAN
jgi:hypothetical protein